MKALGLNIVEEFKLKHSLSREPLEQFVKALQSCNPKHFVELKQTFRSADSVGAHTVFDVKGNKLRAITKISYQLQVVTIIHILTHAEYDEERWKK